MRNTKSTKNRGEHRCSRRARGSYATSGTHCVILIKNQVVLLQASNDKMFKNQIISIIHLIDISAWYWLPISIKQWLKRFSLPLYVRLCLGYVILEQECEQFHLAVENGYVCTAVDSLSLHIWSLIWFDEGFPRVGGIRVVLCIFDLFYLDAFTVIVFPMRIVSLQHKPQIWVLILSIFFKSESLRRAMDAKW